MSRKKKNPNLRLMANWRNSGLFPSSGRLRSYLPPRRAAGGRGALWAVARGPFERLKHLSDRGDRWHEEEEQPLMGGAFVCTPRAIACMLSRLRGVARPGARSPRFDATRSPELFLSFHCRLCPAVFSFFQKSEFTHPCFTTNARQTPPNHQHSPVALSFLSSLFHALRLILPLSPFLPPLAPLCSPLGPLPPSLGGD